MLADRPLNPMSPFFSALKQELPDLEEDTIPFGEIVAKPQQKKQIGTEPKNNDGRKDCYWCGSRTHKRGSCEEYDVCPVCDK